MLVAFAKKWATFIRLVADEHRSSFDRTGIPAVHKQSLSPSKVSALEYHKKQDDVSNATQEMMAHSEFLLILMYISYVRLYTLICTGRHPEASSSMFNV